MLVKFNEMIEDNPIKDLWGIMAKRNRQEDRKEREFNGDLREVSVEQVEKTGK